MHQHVIQNKVNHRKKQTRLSCGGVTASVMTKCLFCNTETGTLHKVSNFDLEEKIRDAALKLDDFILITKLSGGDLIHKKLSII